MRISILRVDPTRRVPLVEFACAIGSGRASWRGSHVAPMVGHEYDVELDLDCARPLLTLVRQSAHARPSMRVVGSRTSLVGLVESAEDDGVAALRLGTGLLLIELERGQELVGRWIELRTTALEAWETGI